MAEVVHFRRELAIARRWPPSFDWTCARLADGPAVVAWLERTGEIERVGRRPTLQSAVQRWRAGERATFWALDRFLAALQLHPSQIPDDAWIRDEVAA